MVHVAPCSTTVSAVGFAAIYTVVRHHGIPKKLLSDRDARFTGHFGSKLQRLMGTRQALSTAFHPQTDGQTERMNRVIEDMIRHHVGPYHDDWDQSLALVEFAINNSWQESIQNTPFHAYLGYDPRTPMAAEVDSKCPAAKSWWASHIDRQNHCRDCLKAAQSRQQANYDTRRREVTFSIGEQPVEFDTDGSPTWTAACIMRQKSRVIKNSSKRREEYLIRWTGYGIEQDTWESAKEIDKKSPQIVTAWLQRFFLPFLAGPAASDASAGAANVVGEDQSLIALAGGVAAAGLMLLHFGPPDLSTTSENSSTPSGPESKTKKMGALSAPAVVGIGAVEQLHVGASGQLHELGRVQSCRIWRGWRAARELDLQGICWAAKAARELQDLEGICWAAEVAGELQDLELSES
eukprot:gene1252-biopygen14118